MGQKQPDYDVDPAVKTHARCRAFHRRSLGRCQRQAGRLTEQGSAVLRKADVPGGAAFASGGVFVGKIVDTCPDTWSGVLMHSADIRPFRVGLAGVKFSPEGEFWAGGEGWIRVRTAPPSRRSHLFANVR
jgi:hypothetical protein